MQAPSAAGEPFLPEDSQRQLEAQEYEKAYFAKRARVEALRAELVSQATGPARTIRVTGLGDALAAANAAQRRALLDALFEKLYVGD